MLVAEGTCWLLIGRMGGAADDIVADLGFALGQEKEI